MPRTVRQIFPSLCYHVINRGNRRAAIFHEQADYAQFVALMREADERVHLPILAACLMPNHLHLVVRPMQSDDLARWTHWLFTTHVRRYHAKHKTDGRIWQGRFKAFVIEEDHHLITVLRYVERNALRAGLVEHAEDWLWGSLRWRERNADSFQLTEPPVRLPSAWRDYVNQAQSADELAALRSCVNRQRPYGSVGWVETKAQELGLRQSLRSVGRPKQQ
jgi:putative transposase